MEHVSCDSCNFARAETDTEIMCKFRLQRHGRGDMTVPHGFGVIKNVAALIVGILLRNFNKNFLEIEGDC